MKAALKPDHYFYVLPRARVPGKNPGGLGLADWTPLQMLPFLSLAHCGCDPEPFRAAARELAGKRILPRVREARAVRVNLTTGESNSRKQGEFDFRSVNLLDEEGAFHLMHFLYHLSGVVFRSVELDIVAWRKAAPYPNPAILEHLSQIKNGGVRPTRLSIQFVSMIHNELDTDRGLSTLQQFARVRKISTSASNGEEIRRVLDFLSGRGQSLAVEVRQVMVFLQEPGVATDFVDRLVEVDAISWELLEPPLPNNKPSQFQLLTTDVPNLNACAPRSKLIMHANPATFRWPRTLDRGPEGNATRFLLHNTNSRQPFKVLVKRGTHSRLTVIVHSYHMSTE